MLDVLRKKATGYETTETVQEYVVDEEGRRILTKEKVSVKDVPPDLSAIKAYMELSEGELYDMSDEELKKEKDRLLKELARAQKGEK